MTSRLAARVISIALHPLVVLLLATAARARRWREVALVAAIAAVPFTLFMIRQVRTGKWENVDASRPEERPRMFVVALVLMAVLAALALRSPSTAFVARGVFAAAAVFVIAWALLRWVKVSLHVACAAMAAVALMRMTPPLGIALAVLVPVLAWARITLERHTLVEIVLGAVIGVGAGWALIAL